MKKKNNKKYISGVLHCNIIKINNFNVEDRPPQNFSKGETTINPFLCKRKGGDGFIKISPCPSFVKRGKFLLLPLIREGRDGFLL
ncbi:MAG TPA: hypothetical protein PLW95_03640 [bacterium]|nr:hypothetical protein [bacterium]